MKKNSDKLNNFEIVKFFLQPLIPTAVYEEYRIDGLVNLKEYVKQIKLRDKRPLAFVRYTDSKHEALNMAQLIHTFQEGANRLKLIQTYIHNHSRAGKS